MLGVDMPQTFSLYYTQLNAMTMYRLRGSSHRPQTEVVIWQVGLAVCTRAAGERGQVWHRPIVGTSSSLAVIGPTLGPLLECVAGRLADADRRHKGLLAFYPRKPAILR